MTYRVFVSRQNIPRCHITVETIIWSSCQYAMFLFDKYRLILQLIRLRRPCCHQIPYGKYLKVSELRILDEAGFLKVVDGRDPQFKQVAIKIVPGKLFVELVQLKNIKRAIIKGKEKRRNTDKVHGAYSQLVVWYCLNTLKIGIDQITIEPVTNWWYCMSTSRGGLDQIQNLPKLSFLRLDPS